MERIFVPPIKIQGIKTKLVPFIKQNVRMDDDSVWIEPFMGSGVVGFNIRPKQAIFADINPHIIAFYNQIKEGNITPCLVRSFLEQEKEFLEDSGEKYYYLVRERFNAEHNPLDFLFLNRSCFNGMVRFNRLHRYNVPYGHKPYRFSKSYVTKIVNQVAWVEKALQENSWDFVCLPFEQTISMAGRNDFIYCDPPYIGRHTDYYNSWDTNSENLLRKALADSGARFIVSTWDNTDFRKNEYIQSVWGDCHKVTAKHFYHIGAKEANRNSVTEALVANYEMPDTQQIQKHEPEAEPSTSESETYR